jgi:Protein of unknown function (DUF2726)
MSTALNAVLDQPFVLLGLLAIGAILGIAVERLIEAQHRARRQAYWKGRKSKNWGQASVASFRPVPANKVDLAAEQLSLVMRADFKSRSLLNQPEARLFRELDQLVIERNADWQVMAQVSVGEFLRCEDAEAYRCVNSKRVDLVLMDERCQARHALEYQGAGHHQGTAAARDAVKKEALRKAGVGYHEVVAGQTTRADLRRLVERLVPAGPIAAG